MGDYFFAHSFYEHRGEPVEERKETKRIRSEDFVLDPRLAFREVLGKGSCGIWFYETAIWDKEKLKAELRKLIEQVDRFAKEYGDFKGY